jgi:hypothetical protein
MKVSTTVFADDLRVRTTLQHQAESGANKENRQRSHAKGK